MGDMIMTATGVNIVRPRSDEVVLRTRNLSKQYGKRLAVDNLNLEVHHGDIFGFLGPNGASKTTTIRMALGLIVAPFIILFTVSDVGTFLHQAPLKFFYSRVPANLTLLRVFSGIFLLILTANVIGVEYQLGTIRILLARGVGRVQLLLSKVTRGRRRRAHPARGWSPTRRHPDMRGRACGNGKSRCAESPDLYVLVGHAVVRPDDSDQYGRHHFVGCGDKRCRALAGIRLKRCIGLVPGG
jgi:energy-coupling factor transporter ATP-binding protein EcfA2